MYIIKLDAIDSTNAYLKTLVGTTLPKDFTVVVASSQSKGRGQMGTSWQSQHGKNLTVSVFKRLDCLTVNQQFYVSMLVSLAICDALKSFYISKLSVKWPNDILAGNSKICGILIENVIKNNQLKGCIIGIGLNVNQKFFDHLPRASSMSLINGVIYDLDEVLHRILKQLEIKFKNFNAQKFEPLKRRYEMAMFRKEKPSTFKSDEGVFSGIIKGVTKTGQLKIWTEDDHIKVFDFKSVELFY